MTDNTVDVVAVIDTVIATVVGGSNIGKKITTRSSVGIDTRTIATADAGCVLNATTRSCDERLGWVLVTTTLCFFCIAISGVPKFTSTLDSTTVVVAAWTALKT